MTDRQASLAALGRCFDDLVGLTADLSPADWEVQSLCPDWTVHGVVTHAVGIENLLVGWMPATDDEPPPFAKMAEFEAEAAGLTGADLASRGAEILEARRSELTTLTDDDWGRKCMTPVGPATYGRFMNVRVFDFGVQQRDLTIPLGRDPDDSGPAAEIALDEVHGSLGYIVGKKIGLPDGMSIGFDLSGGINRKIYAAVEGRAGVVDHVDEPDVQVSADTTTFIMLACGRLDPQEQIDAGRISWSGNDEWGEKAARSLRFTM